MADLPLYLLDQTEENIMNRMLNKVPSDIDKSEGSFIWDAQAPVAFMLSEAALWAQELPRAEALQAPWQAIVRISVPPN